MMRRKRLDRNAGEGFEYQLILIYLLRRN